MCGIIGYVGARSAVEIVLDGLARLEYRGYDSAGLALLPEGEGDMVCLKTAGKVADLRAMVGCEVPEPVRAGFRAGIGHTRWATHGPPTEANAHPHLSRNRRFAVVHNGIIENHAALRAQLEKKGFSFRSQTDTEVLPHLIEACYEGDFRRAVAAALERVEGAYGIAVLSSLHPGVVVVARNGSPIAVGVGSGETLAASDPNALLGHTRQIMFLEDGDIGVLSAAGADIVERHSLPVKRELTRVDWDSGALAKGGFAHYMLKEIHEQPEALADCLRGRLLEHDGTVRLGGLRLAPAELARTNRILIAACGTSCYAGMVGRCYFEELAGIPAEVEQAAEFRYRNPIIEPDTCMIAISQSGETADTLEAVREGKRKGARVLGVCNAVGSSIARECGMGVYLHAGPEIGVASTKAFTCQLAALAMLAIAFGRARRMSAAEGRELVRELARAPELVRAVLAEEGRIREAAAKYSRASSFFYLGRGCMYPVALEGALKLKEISYIHAEGCHAAELKHGPIALLDASVPVMAAAPDLPGKAKMLGNMQECRARGAPVIALGTEGDREVEQCADEVLRIPRCAEFLAPIPAAVAMQLFAYHAALARGCPIDQPRNLAKSVTVE